MPVSGHQPYLRASIASILNQSFEDFEVIIVSEPNAGLETAAVIKSRLDHRIRHVRNIRHIGLARSLNIGLQKARGEYVARMDSDDICLAERLARQVKFLDERKDVGVVGTGFKVIDEEGRVILSHSEPSEPALTKWRLLFGDIIAHPSVMVRASIFRKLGGYDSRALHVEDYDLWMRAARITGIVNLPDLLLGLRKHGHSISHKYSQVQLHNSLRISKRAIEEVLRNEISAGTFCALVLHSAARPRDAWDAAKVLYSLCMEYIRRGALSREEEKDVRTDAAKRMQIPLLQAIRNQPFFSLKICQLIAQIRARMLPRIMISSLERATAYAWRHLL